MAAARAGTGGGARMILVDSALKARERSGRPVRVGMIGAGAMGRAIANQIANAVPGMRLVAISNRHLDTACRAFGEAGVEDVAVVDSLAALERAVDAGRSVVTDDPSLLCRADAIEAIIEVTGSIEFAAGVVLDAIDHGKHVILMNAELDGTLGPILKARADRAGVILTACEGDQPGVEMNLYRFVKGIGLTPLLCGNIKGLQDHYRTPTTQEGYARRWGLKPEMATSFADGTKISFEQAIVANGTGMRVARRGMLGYDVGGGTAPPGRISTPPPAATMSTGCAGWAGSSITSWGRARHPASSSSRRTTIPSSGTC